MALRDIFKKKKPPEEKIERPIEKQKEIRTPTLPPPSRQRRAPEIVTVPKRERKTVIGEAYKILKTPQVTEKATDLVKKNQYVFKVYSRANKVEIEKAIENLYGVDVLGVKIINLPPKKRRLGKIRGWRKGYKKAIVRIKEGQKIEVLPR